jgi:hypothetical protein
MHEHLYSITISVFKRSIKRLSILAIGGWATGCWALGCRASAIFMCWCAGASLRFAFCGLRLARLQAVLVAGCRPASGLWPVESLWPVACGLWLVACWLAGCVVVQLWLQVWAWTWLWLYVWLDTLDLDYTVYRI